MKSLTVGKLKAHFSEVLDDVKKGEEIVIEYGKSHKKVAAIIPYSQYQANKRVKLGALKGKASFKMHDDFKMTDEELLSL